DPDLDGRSEERLVEPLGACVGDDERDGRRQHEQDAARRLEPQEVTNGVGGPITRLADVLKGGNTPQHGFTSSVSLIAARPLRNIRTRSARRLRQRRPRHPCRVDLDQVLAERPARLLRHDRRPPDPRCGPVHHPAPLCEGSMGPRAYVRRLMDEGRDWTKVLLDRWAGSCYPRASSFTAMNGGQYA